MIFDSPRMRALRAKYAGVPNHRVPQIVLLDRCEDLAGERAYLEEVAASVPERKHSDWVARLLSDDDAQHLGAWFEIMLCAWLREVGTVEVEPEIRSALPDFRLEIGEVAVYIEARAILRSDEENERRRHRHDLVEVLGKLPYPYLLRAHIVELKQPLDTGRLTAAVAHWLQATPGRTLSYRERDGNWVRFSAHSGPGRTHVGIVPVEVDWVEPQRLRPALREKAGQHRTLREAGEPYVIAVLLDSPWLSAEEVVEAWFGTPTVTLDVETGKIVREGLDGKGLHFLGPEVRHTSVSATLAFTKFPDSSVGRHELRAWYVENPYAKAVIPTDLFPVEGRFVVVERTQSSFRMDWRR